MQKTAKPKQLDRVIAYMIDFGSISQLEAIRDIGVMRLASRISDAKKAGYDIKKTMERGKNRYGEEVYYARYEFKNIPEA